MSKASVISLVALLSMTLLACSSQRKAIAITKKKGNELISSPALQNAHVGIAILDNATGKYIYNYQGDKYFVPASNTKIATCYAAMKYLGDSLPALTYRLMNDSTIDISGTGDPSFLLAEFRYQPAFELLKKYRHITLHMPIFEEALGNGWAWNDFQEAYMAPRSQLPLYGDVANFRLDAQGRIHSSPSSFENEIKLSGEALDSGFAVSRNWDNNVFTALPGKALSATVPFNTNPGTMRSLLADTLKAEVELDPFGEVTQGATMYSQPVDSILKPMMHRSDNFFAEQMLMMVCHRLNGTFRLDGLTDSLLNTEYKSLPQRPRWADGSGLSRYNLFTPLDMIGILRLITRLPNGLQRIKNILATGGEGSLANYYLDEKEQIYAKTGTLSGVVALSGIIYTKQGKELIFSVLVNNHRSSATDVRRAVEKFLKELRQH